MIHGIAWAYGLGCWLVWAITSSYGEPLLYLGRALGAVTAVAAGVSSLWSISLALRAMFAGERLRFPLLVVASSLYAPAAIACFIWPHILMRREPESELSIIAIEWGLPLLLPYAALTATLVAPLGWSIARRAEGLHISRGGDAWAPRQRMKRWFLWSCASGMLFTALLLPFPLYIYSVIIGPGPGALGGRYSHFRCRSFRQFVAHYTPDYVKNVVHDAYATSKSSWMVLVKKNIVYDGELPLSRLRRYLNSSDENLCGFTWFEMEGLLPEATLDFALKVGKGEEWVPACAQERAGLWVGWRGTAQDIASHLSAARQSTEHFLEGLIRGIPGSNLPDSIRRQFIPQLKDLANGPSPCRLVALLSLFRLLSPEERSMLWKEYASDSSPKRRRDAVEGLYASQDLKGIDDLISPYLSDPEVSVRRRSAALMVSKIECCGWESKRIGIKWEGELVKILDDPDIVVRRAATWALWEVTRPRVSPLQATPVYWKMTTPQPGQDSISYDFSGIPVPETQAEIAERAQIRAAVQKWIERQKGLQVSGDK